MSGRSTWVIGHAFDARENTMTDTPASAIAALHAAMAKLANGDVADIKALYSHTADATSFYGWGGWEKGWDAVSERWDWAGAQFKGGSVSYQPVTLVTADTLFYTTDIETFRMTDMDGLGKPTQWSNRVTHIFRLEVGETGTRAWRLIHRHGNRLEDQFKPASRMG
jgi:ketosteroid isomerase-like protein